MPAVIDIPTQLPPRAAPEPPTVLVVDDDATIRSLLRAVLEAERCRVLTARDAMEALDTAATFPERIDTALVDIVMPRTLCRELVRRLRALRPNLDVVLMTGYDPRDLQFPPELPVLLKPFARADLLERVRRIPR
jgi:CheY-like chemotaxis protein